MGKILGAYLMPHPPIAVPEVGKEETNTIKATMEAYKACSSKIKNQNPDTIIIITPHGPVFQDGIAIYAEDPIKGDLGRFGCPKVQLSFPCNMILTDAILLKSAERGIQSIGINERNGRQYGISLTMDHGALVPLYFVNQQFSSFSLVHITIGLLPYEELYEFGKSIQEAVKAGNHDVVIIASGDLSHRLTSEAPAGYHPRAVELDDAIVSHVREFDVKALVEMDQELIECGGECGLRPIIMMMGALDGHHVTSKVLSYEGPFGVGYCVADFEPGSFSRENEMLSQLYHRRQRIIEKIRKDEDPHVALARYSLEEYIRNHREIKTLEHSDHEMLKQKAGVFVSIKKHGELRGCIGTILPTRDNVAEEIIQNAISAGIRDPRFPPVEEWELDELVYSVDVLRYPEPIASKDQLDVKKYGVIVKNGGRTGLLLPNLEGVDTVEEQIEIALRKAGIEPGEEYELERFEVIRYK